jgi:lipopolysaccharide biosynthesis glycosyltransferase
MPHQHTPSTINLFCAVDDGFAMPLAAALQSALHNLKTTDQVHIVVASDGIQPENKQKLLRLVVNAEVDATIDIIEPETDLIEEFPTTRSNTRPMYLRLLVDRLVPADWKRVIYIDGDVIVRGDLGELWKMSMDGHVVLAVPDFVNPKVAQRPASLQAAYRKEYGLSPDAPYFMSGMMLIDLCAWEREEIGRRSLEFLERYGETVEYGDQDALNGALAGRWGTIDPAWNLPLHNVPRYGWPDHDSTENRARQEQLLENPLIVHYSGKSKPWHHLYRRTMDTEFFRYLVDSRWFSPWESRRWVWSRRVSHSLLRLIPEKLLTTVRDQVRRA